MGSFSVACSASGISITAGQDAVFIPLLPNKNEFSEDKSKNVVLHPMSMIVTNDGIMSLYIPFSLPIFGRYNDYGSLEDIEETETVKAIEKYFNITIDEFMEVVTRNWCEDNTENLKDIKNQKVIRSLSGCFINREIYDLMTSSKKHPYSAAYEEIAESIKEHEELYADSKKSKHDDYFFFQSISHKMPIPNWGISFHTLYNDEVKSLNPSLKEEFMKYCKFDGNMWINNKIFMPMYSGSQCGEPEAQLKFYENVVSVLKKQLMKYKS